MVRRPKTNVRSKSNLRAKSNFRWAPPLQDRLRSWWQGRKAGRSDHEPADDDAPTEDDAEVEAPRLQFTRWLGVGAAVVCVGLVGVALLHFGDWQTRTQQFIVTEFVVEGEQRVSEKAVVDASEARWGTSLMAIDRDQVSRNVEKLPWVRQAVAQQVLPNKLVLRVREYQPFALQLSGGKLYLVDRSGYVFKEADTGEAADLPIITGLTAELRRDAHKPVAGEMLETPHQHRLMDLLRLIDAHAASDLAQRFPLSEVHWDPVLGTTLVSARDGSEVRLGKTMEADLTRAFALLDRLVKRVDEREEWLQYALLDDDLRPDRAVVRSLPLALVHPGGGAEVALPRAPTLALAEVLATPEQATPTDAVEGEALADDKAAAGQKPASALDRPAATPQKSAVTSPRPAVTPQKSAATTPRSAVTSQKSAATTPKSAATSQKSATTTPRPAVTSQKSGATSPRPVVASQKSAGTTGKPAPAADTPND